LKNYVLNSTFLHVLVAVSLVTLAVLVDLLYPGPHALAIRSPLCADGARTLVLVSFADIVRPSLQVRV
jgi:hypothetical protein